MDIFDTLYLGTPANQALDASLALEQKMSMTDAAAETLSELPEFKAEFHEECRTLEGRGHR